MEEGYFLVLIGEKQLFSLAWGQVVCFLHTHLHTYVHIVTHMLQGKIKNCTQCF